MSQSSQSDSETKEAGMTPQRDYDSSTKMTEYEKQRMKRIEANKARMKSLGLDKAATLLMGSIPISQKSNKKGKQKVRVEEDEEYKPSDKDDDSSSSSESSDEFFVSRTKQRVKYLKLSGNSGSTPTKKNAKVSSKKSWKNSGNSDYVNDDDALMKAIALSLQDSSGFLDVGSKMPDANANANASVIENTERNPTVGKDDSGKRKRKNSFTSRVKMTDDEMILHFFQFDEAGKGGINLRDLRGVASSHDFTWNDEEMVHMIHFFDSDGDGKLSLDDFTKIVERCNMRQGSEIAEQASLAS